MDSVKSLLAASIVSASLGFALPAGAEPLERSAADVERAEQHFRKGTRAFEEQRYSEAYALLRAAWDLSPSYRTATGLGQVELHLGQFRDAAAHLSFCLRHFPADGDPKVRAHVEQGLLEAREHVGALRVRVNVEGAEVAVDGAAAGKSPLEGLLFVEPGSHVVTATKDGKTARATVEGHVRATEEVELAVPFDVTAPPGAAALPEAPAGTASDPAREPSRGLPPSSLALIVGGSLTAVALGTSIAFYVKGSNADDDANARASQLPNDPSACLPGGASVELCRAADEKFDERNDANRVGLAAAVGSGVFAAATVATFFALRASERSQSAASVPLSIGFRSTAGGGLLSVHGGF